MSTDVTNLGAAASRVNAPMNRTRQGAGGDGASHGMLSAPNRPPADCHPDRPHEARGLCHACYQAAWKADALPEPPARDPIAHRCDRGHRPSRTCYVGCLCRCDECRGEVRAYSRRRNREMAYGTWDPARVDAGPVREHVADLMCAGRRGSHHRGVGLKQIAKVSGVAHGTLWKLMYGAPDRAGPSKTVRRQTADRLLKVTRDDAADGVSAPGAATRRRLDAMIEGGFTKAELARYITGNPGADSLQIARGSKARVSMGNARRVKELHEDWKAGRIVPRGRRSRWEYGPPSHVPASPAPSESPRGEDTVAPCVDCGADAMAGGALRCLPCFQQQAKGRPTTGCGTDAGYARHRRRGETPCQSCREAHTNRNEERKAVAS